MSLSRVRWVADRETGGIRYQRRCIGGSVLSALPGAQQLTGGAVPPFPCRARSRCVHLAPRSALIPRASHPTSNPLFTDGRPVSGAFVLPAASRRSFKVNALPMSGLLCDKITVDELWNPLNESGPRISLANVSRQKLQETSSWRKESPKHAQGWLKPMKCRS